MKAAFFTINLAFGLVGVLLGIATLWSVLGATHNYSVAVVGLGILVLGGLCLCLCGDCVSNCLSDRRNHHAS